jgi:predicted GNAT family acetyltransferase
MTHVLDRPMFSALKTCHAMHAEGGPLALRYRSAISPFAATVDDSPDALAALGQLVEPGSAVVVGRVGAQAVPVGTFAEHVTTALQMVADTPAPPARDIPFLELSARDGPEMYELASMTKPGPYNPQAYLFGGYIGIRHHNRLVAMAGQRMQVPGLTEVSAVCNHPDFRGKGYGSFLMSTVAARIRARGETPFLHVYSNNTNAIRLYETLGYARRAEISVTVLRRA